MTTILAGANYTMWPGLNPRDFDMQLSTATFRRREWARQSYGFVDDVSFTREFEPLSEGWFGAWIWPMTNDFTTVAGYFLELIDSNGDTLVGLSLTSDDNMAVNAPFLSEEVVALIFDSPAGEIAYSFRFDDTDGYLRVFGRGEELFSFQGDTVGSTQGAAVGMRLTRHTTNSGVSRTPIFSEILLSTEPTLGFKVVDTELSVASLSQWDGTPSNITPVGYASTEDSLSTEDADQLVTFSRPAIPALDEDDFIASVHFETSQLAASGAPAPEADLLVYDGSEHGAERVQPGTSFSEFRVQWDQDPRTNAPWTEAGVNEIEVGVASRTA